MSGQVSYHVKPIVRSACFVGLALPVFFVVVFQICTYAGLGPTSAASKICVLAAALFWPTYLPYGLVTGGKGFTFGVVPLLAILATANMAIYGALALVGLWEWNAGRRLILTMFAFLIFAYWWWVISSFWPR